MVDYLEEIKKIIENQFGIPVDQIEDDSLLDQDLSITDLDLEDLMENIQNRYQIQIPENKVSSFKTVADIASFITENADNPS